MRRLVRFTCDDVRPGRAEVLRRMQMPEDTPVSARLEALEGAAATAFEKLARPVGVFEAVSAEEFLRLYADARGSAGDTPLHHVVPRAGALALFAATLGAGVDAEIRQRFRAGDAPSGWALDAFASAAAERVADRLGECYRLALGDTGPAPGLRVLPYSPGHCGWDVSGQAALFRALVPIEIGITLSARCLMQPIKSVSGVLVAGSPDTHTFRPTFDFCEPCLTKDCCRRMASVRRQG